MADTHSRDAKWTESIAVGDQEFVQEAKEKLGVQAAGRKIEAKDGVYELREAQASYSYSPLFDPEKCTLSSKNSYFWDKSC
jgi:hypothetical protein